jgi:hypothetical protein
MSVTWWGIALFLVALFAVTRLRRMRKRANQSPWRTVHDPMMISWSRAVGFEVGASEKEGRVVNPFLMLSYLIRSVHPDWSLEQSLGYLTQQISRFSTFADEQLIQGELERRADTSVDIERVRELFRASAGNLLSIGASSSDPNTALASSPRSGTDNLLLAYAVVAAEVEARFGSLERGKYLVAVIVGNAH